MPNETLSDLDVQILSHFRRDRLCGTCHGPIEADRKNTCWRCDLKVHANAQLQWLELGVMNLGYKLGIRRKPTPTRDLTPDQSEPKTPTDDG